MLRAALALVFASTAVFGQNVISAKAGLVNYHDGDVQIAGESIQSKPSQFVSLKVGQELRTGLGRAEVLMTPGVFLRLGENSAVRMISNSLTEPKVALIEGSALVACMDVPKDTPIMVSYGDRSAYLTKNGLYRFDATATEATLRVYEGEAKVGEVDVKKGRELSMTGFAVSKELAKFDTKDTDELYRWASRRDQYISMANVSAARSVGSGYASGGYGGYTGYPTGSMGCGNAYFGAYSGYFGQRGGWRFNPCFGMFTYVPYNGIFTSPFGWNYFSPSQVSYLYYPQYSRGIGNGISGGGSSVGFTRSYDPSHGYDVMSSRGSFGAMSSGGGSSSAGFPASSGSTGAAAAAGSARSGGDAGGRGASAGGRGH